MNDQNLLQQLDMGFKIIDSTIKIHNMMHPENPVNWDEVLNYFANVKLHDKSH